VKRAARGAENSLAHEKHFRARVLKVYESLTPQQQLVADFMLEHVREVAFLSVPELSARTGTSDATVVRFAQSLGFDGYTQLKNALSSALRDEVVSALPKPLSELKQKHEDAVSRVMALELANIQKSVDALDRKVVATAADALYAADHVFAFGVGISGHFADLFVYQLLQVGVRASTIPNRLPSPVEALAAARPRDLVAVFSFPPYYDATISLARAAREQGFTLLAFSDKLSSKVARLADHVLTARSDNMMYTNAFAAMSVVLNALVTVAALRNEQRAGAALAHIRARDGAS
jgi:DNA-binding MurR/RpiR family transcriptional regulator